jgi:thiol-disulfide isomerase/thioredoxin
MTNDRTVATRRVRRQLLLAAGFMATLPWPQVFASESAPSRTMDGSGLVTLERVPLEPAVWFGRPLVLVFWATWCPYCQRHNARLDALYQASALHATAVLGVTLETDALAVRTHVRRQGWHFPVAMADKKFRAQWTDRKVVPMTCLVSASGELLKMVAGEMSPEDVMSLGNSFTGSKPKIAADY